MWWTCEHVSTPRELWSSFPCALDLRGSALDSFAVEFRGRINIIFNSPFVYDVKNVRSGWRGSCLCKYSVLCWVIFLKKKNLLVGASSMLRTGQWIIQWVRDVCMSHQSHRIYYKQPIKFLVLKVNGMWEDSIPIQFRTAIFILLWKRRKYFLIFCGLC